MLRIPHSTSNFFLSSPFHYSFVVLLVNAPLKTFTKALLLRHHSFGRRNTNKSLLRAEHVVDAGMSPKRREADSARQFHAVNPSVIVYNQMLSPKMHTAATKTMTASKLGPHLLPDSRSQAYGTGSESPNQGFGTNLFPLCNRTVY